MSVQYVLLHLKGVYCIEQANSLLNAESNFIFRMTNTLHLLVIPYFVNLDVDAYVSLFKRGTTCLAILSKAEC